MMSVLNRFWTIIVIAGKRILSQPWMTLATLVGIFFAITLTISVPLYAGSVYNRLFLTQLNPNGVTGDQTRQPFSILFTYNGSMDGNLQWEDVQPVETFLRSRASAILQLPILRIVHYFATNPLAVFPEGISTFTENEKPLLWSSVITLEDYEPNITITEGRYPVALEDGPLEVLVSDELAAKWGVQVGETYTLFSRGKTTQSIPFIIAGIYQATDPSSDYWFVQPQSFTDYLLVPLDTFKERISPLLSDEIYIAYWFVLADGSSVSPDNAMQMALFINKLQRQAEDVLPNIMLFSSPLEALVAYQRSANLLTLLLFAYCLPIFGLLLTFINMTSAMTVDRQRNEIAILRSRGATVIQIVAIAAVESLILSGIALALSLPASAAVAQLISHTRSFLVLTGQGPTVNGELSLTQMIGFISPKVLTFGLAAIAITMLARLLPTLRAARDTIVVYKIERSRNLRPPFWQRAWLDLLLLIPSAYGIYLLRLEGSIDAFNASATGYPFSNPLLILAPSLLIFVISLFCLRLLPLLMSTLAWLTARTNSVGVMMAARHLARTPANYSLPLVLLILTLSLSAFIATLAGTLDHHLYDQKYYQVGADVRFVDLGDSPQDLGAAFGANPADSGSGGSATNQVASLENQPGWYFLPVTEYLRLPNVTNVTRVGRYAARVISSNLYQPAAIYGVDRSTLPGIAFWRPDFASASLGTLMNRLGAMPDGVLVSEDFLAKHAITQNDLITLQIFTNQNFTDVDFHVAGSFKLFPTYYPDGEPLFIANLDYIFQEMGGQYPYEVWMKTDGSMDLQRASSAAAEIYARTMSWTEPGQQILAEQERPERQGLFGVLTFGFGAAALLTVIGFLMYALLSYQRRFVELGVLRAIGISSIQLTTFLATELAFLIITGGGIGTLLGVWVSNLFIPYLQVSAGDVSAKIPPYVVYVAWPEILRVYILFGVLFLAALAGLILLLSRMKIFQAIKMGEAT